MYEPLTADQMQRDFAWAAFKANGFDLPKKARLSPREFALEYANRKNIRASDFLGPTRVSYVTKPRQDCMADMKRRFPQMSFRSIGKIFGGRDHSTVMYSVRKSNARAGL